MYITEIDDILDKTLDTLMYNWILKPDKNLINYSKLIKETNFIKYQKEINLLFEFSEGLIKEYDIKKFITKESNIEYIKNIILKYIGFYIFISIGINYNGKIESYNNNLIEFTRNQINYNLKIENFFNTNSNSKIIKSIKLINEILDYFKKLTDNKKKEKNLLNLFSSELNEFIKLYGEDNINELIKIYKKKDSKIILDHNIIKIIIYVTLYKNNEKKEIFDIIESAENTNGEFTFIDIIVPKTMFIDYNSIESILSPSEINTELPEKIYDIINENYSQDLEETRKYYTDYDLKIKKLFDTHLIIPIVDDFLLYHKDNEKYERSDNKDVKNDDTKIKYIINKINFVSDYYNNEEEIKKLFHIPLKDRNGVLVNTFEDVKIISKMKNIISMDNDKVDLFNDLINYKLYPYISFKDFKKNGIFLNSNKTINSLRNVSFDNLKKFNIMQDRVISNNMHVNIVGLAIINNDSQIDCLNSNSFINICEKTNNPLPIIKSLINEKLTNNTTKLKNNYFWLFDLEKQKINIPKYDISKNMPKNDILKIVLAYLYDYTIENVLSLVKNDIKNDHSKSLEDYKNDINKIAKFYPDINNNQYSDKINELEYLIYFIKSKKIEDLYDYNEDKFPGLFGKIYKLPVISKKDKNFMTIINLKSDFKIKKIEESNDNLIEKQIDKNLDIYEEDDNKDIINAIYYLFKIYLTK